MPYAPVQMPYALSEGRARLVPKGTEPELQRDLGCDPIGWEDDGYVYLIPEVAHRAVARFCASAERHFGVSVDQLKRLLLDRGYLVRPDDPKVKRLEVSVRAGSRVERAIRLRRSAVIEDYQPTAEEVAEEQARTRAYDALVQ